MGAGYLSESPSDYLAGNETLQPIPLCFSWDSAEASTDRTCFNNALPADVPHSISEREQPSARGAQRRATRTLATAGPKAIGSVISLSPRTLALGTADRRRNKGVCSVFTGIVSDQQDQTQRQRERLRRPPLHVPNQVPVPPALFPTIRLWDACHSSDLVHTDPKAHVLPLPANFFT